MALLAEGPIVRPAFLNQAAFSRVEDISEATFDDLAAQHEARARFAMATQ